MTPQDFIAKWGSPGGVPGPAYALNEEQGAQSHFLDLCELLGVPKPGSAEGYRFEEKSSVISNDPLGRISDPRNSTPCPQLLHSQNCTNFAEAHPRIVQSHSQSPQPTSNRYRPCYTEWAPQLHYRIAMTNIRQIVIGPSPENPALVVRPSADIALFNRGTDQPNNGVIGKILSAINAVPDLLLAGYVGSPKLMEVEIHGDLVRASDGAGYRAFAMGDNGIVEHGKLFDPTNLSALIDVALVWRLSSIFVGQKHLSDISETLRKLEKGVAGIAQFQRDEQASKIEATYEYLRQAEASLSLGERDLAVRHRLEVIENEMDAIQKHLSKIFNARLDTPIESSDLIGYEDTKKGFALKIQELQNLLHEHCLAGLTRVGALQMLSAFHGGEGLKRARAKAILESTAINVAMCDSLNRVMCFEVTQWRGRFESMVKTTTDIAASGAKLSGYLLMPTLFLKMGGEKRELKEHLESLLKPRGSDTPELDALKLGAILKIRETAAVGSENADRLAQACSSVDSLIAGSAQTTRFLAEWGPSGPTRIRQLLNC